MIAVKDALANNKEILIYDPETGTILGPDVVAFDITGMPDDILEDIACSDFLANAFIDDNPDRVLTLWVEG